MDTTELWIIGGFFAALAAIMLPLLKRDLYETSFKIEVFGVPLVSILGVIGAGVSLWCIFIFAAAVPVYP